MAKTEEDYPQPTPTQAELDAIKRGEAGVTDTAEDDADDKSADQKDVTADKAGAYKTRQAKAD